MDWSTVVTPLIIIAVPALLAKTKHWLGDRTWLIPIVAAALGVVADAIAAYTLHTPMSPTQGTILGLAGVGLREVVDQLRAAATA